MPSRLTLIVRLLLPAVVGMVVFLIEPVSVRADATLSGTWQLVEFRSMSDDQAVRRPDGPSGFTMMLAPNGDVHLQLGCNSASGTWATVSDDSGRSGRFRFGPLAGTRAICPPPRIDELVMAQAPYIRGYLWEEGMLHLTLMADGGIFSWRRISGVGPGDGGFSSPDDGGPRRFRVLPEVSSLRLRAGSSTVSKVVGSYRGGDILWNLGCLAAGGRAWCDVQALRGGARGYVAAEFLRPAIGPDGAPPMGNDDSALRAGRGDFDASGSLPCAESAGKPMTLCDFSVSRGTGGDATIVISRPDGLKRTIFFAHGLPLSADTAESEGLKPFTSRKQTDLHFIGVGGERYEIPDAVPLGG